MKKLFNFLVITICLHLWSYGQNDYSFKKLGWPEDSIMIGVKHLRTQNSEQDIQLQDPKTLINEYLSDYVWVEDGWLVVNIPKNYQAYTLANFQTMQNSAIDKIMVTIEKVTYSDGYMNTERKYFRTYDLIGKGVIKICPTNEKALVILSL